jgi:hypothetical protein
MTEQEWLACTEAAVVVECHRRPDDEEDTPNEIAK